MGERGVRRKTWLLVQFQSEKAVKCMREELRTGGMPGVSGREGIIMGKCLQALNSGNANSNTTKSKWTPTISCKQNPPQCGALNMLQNEWAIRFL